MDICPHMDIVLKTFKNYPSMKSFTPVFRTSVSSITLGKAPSDGNPSRTLVRRGRSSVKTERTPPVQRGHVGCPAKLGDLQLRKRLLPGSDDVMVYRIHRGVDDTMPDVGSSPPKVTYVSSTNQESGGPSTAHDGTGETGPVRAKWMTGRPAASATWLWVTRPVSGTT